MSNSSEERIVLPGASILADFMLTQMTKIIRGMRVDERRMRANLETTRGLIFSEKVLTALVEAGMSRQHAYALVQRAATRTWETGDALLEVLRSEPEVTSALSEDVLARAFELDPYLEHIDTAFERAGLGGELRSNDRDRRHS
jgi:adenylosuccinate lyase